MSVPTSLPQIHPLDIIVAERRRVGLKFPFRGDWQTMGGREDARVTDGAGGLVPEAIEWMAEQVPGGFFIYRADESQELLYVNEALLRIFGCDTLDQFRDLTGYTFKGLVHPEDFEAIQSSIDDQIADESNKNLDYVEYRIIRRDGSV